MSTLEVQPLAQQLLAGPRLQAAPDPAPPTYRWFACNLVSGLIVDELPMEATTVTQAIGSYQSITCSMPIPDAPATWETCTVPGLSLLVCAREDDMAIVGGGIVVHREGGSASTLDLSLVTCEGYLDRRFMHDATLNADQADIERTLVGWANSDGIGLVIDAPNEGKIRERAYKDSDDATIYQRLTELSGVIDGPEWAIFLDFDAAQTKVIKTFRSRDMLGVQSPTPPAVFSMAAGGAGNVTEYALSEDYSSETGANEVLAIGDAPDDGEDSARLESSAHVDGDLLVAGWPVYESRSTYSGVTRLRTLEQHAAGDLARMRVGSKGLTLSADAASSPRVRTDWTLGDTLGVEVDSSPRHPDGFSKVLRAVGYSLDTGAAGTLQPTLVWED